MTAADATSPGRVLVVGAGPVGLVAALLLARAGVHSLLLEARERVEGVGSRAICFQRDVLDILERVGCGEAAVARGVTWWRGLTFYRQHVLFETTFPEAGRSAFPPFINISQSAVEQLLWERVHAEPLVEARLGARVEALAQDDTGVRVRCAEAVGEEAGAYLLACDGAGSTVRRLLDLPFPGHSFREQFLIADVRARLPFPPERHFHFDPVWNPGRQVLVHPQPDDVWRIDWQVPDDFHLDRERTSGALDRRIQRITGHVPYEIVWLSVYRFHQRVVPRMRVGRVLLAGDAAHLVSPFGARGLNSGAQDAENAAWKLAAVLHGHAGAQLLDSYHAERHAAALENLRVTGETMRFLVPRDEADRRRRRTLLERAVEDPQARALVDSGKLAEPYWYLASPLTTPAGDRSSFPTEPGVARPVLPGVLCPDAPCRVRRRPAVRRLRHLFGNGFVLLVNAEDAGPALAAAERTGAPLEVHRLGDLAPPPTATTSADLAAVLAIEPGDALLVRPDGHIAATVAADDHAAIAAVVTRALGGS